MITIEPELLLLAFELAAHGDSDCRIATSELFFNSPDGATNVRLPPLMLLYG